ncbi:hypothetical protein [Phenylobacterium immobile]|nr:hypothetical protein [Phenylobacterium immobile]
MSARFGSREHINAVAAFLVSRCGIPIEDAGWFAVEIVNAARGVRK